MKQDGYSVIRRPLITEKGMAAVNGMNQYPFEVDISANKAQVKRAVEGVFSVRVTQVRTMTRHGKPRRVRYRKGKTREWKRAVVTLAAGDTIEFI